MDKGTDPHPHDPLHTTSSPDVHWTTVNLSEGIPGVLTPLNWSLWDRAVNQGMRDAASALGALTPADAQAITSLQVFFGRVAFAADIIAMIGDRMPATTGQEAVESVFAGASGIPFAPTRRRYPSIAWRLPCSFVRTARGLRRFEAAQASWWASSNARLDQLTMEEAIDLLVEARGRHDQALSMQCRSVVVCIQPVYTALARLVEHAGSGDLSKLSAPPGGVEIDVVSDIWRASRGTMSVAEVVRRHGFHGPLEGEVSSSSWRESDAPLRAMVSRYAGRPDDDSPIGRDAERRRQRPDVERAFTRAAPAPVRPLAAVILRLAREILPLRGVAKRSLLQSLDVARAAARRIGAQLAVEGRLDDPEDVFYLTVDELAAHPDADRRALVAFRRQRREEYLQLELPQAWVGAPRPIAKPAQTSPTPVGTRIDGIGASAGVVEGVAQVMTVPDFVDVEPDQVLVATTTDPSWAGIMVVSKALVVDVGGALSHAAVVARELEIPCVVNTVHGTSAIRTGDRVRVDGTAGTVDILARVEHTEPVPTTLDGTAAGST